MFKSKRNRLFAHAFFTLSGCLSAASVWATVAEPPELIGLPWAQIGIAGVISLWGGVGRTAVRAIEDAQQLKDKPNEQTNFNLKSELLKDLFVSSGIGFFVYTIGMHQAWNTWLLAPALWIGGYMGTKLLGGVGDAILDYLTKIADRGPKL